MATTTVTHPPKVLFWINKDTSSGGISNSSREQRSAIQSQIQRGRPRKRKPKHKKPDSETDASPSGSSNTSAPNPLLVDRPKELYDAPTRAIYAPTDPFNTASVQIDQTAHGLLRYYIHYYHPAQWPNEPFSRDKGPYSYKASVHRIVNTAVQDQLMMFCLLSAASSRIQHIDRLKFPSVARKQDRYTQMAIRLMRERVSEQVERDERELHALLQCMLFLGMYYVYGDDFEAGRVHLQVSLALLEQFDGVNALKNRHLQEQILMSDLFLSCVNLEPCACGWKYDPGPADVLGLQPYELRSQCPEDEFMGSALLGKDDDLIPSELKVLVEQIVETYQVKSRLQTSTMTCTRALETGRWITRRNMAIRARLLDVMTTEDRLHALRTVLIMWTLLSMNITGRLKTVKIMAAKLRTILEGIGDEDWITLEDVRLWILLVGYTCSTEGSEFSEWYFKEIQANEVVQISVLEEILYGSNLSEWLEGFQKGFLYHGLVQRPAVLRMAGKLIRTDERLVTWEG